MVGFLDFLLGRAAVQQDLKLGFWILFLLSLTGLSYLSFFAGIPLTYDEVYNYYKLAGDDLLRIATYYFYQGNHIFFSMFSQYFSSPTAVFEIWQPFLRSGNVCIGAMQITLISRFFYRLFLDKETFSNKSIAFVCSIVCSLGVGTAANVFMLYYVVARGYLLGNLCLFLGLWNLSQNREKAYVPLALSAYCVPIFSYYFPFVFLLHAQRGFKNSIIIGLKTVLMLAILYAPTGYMYKAYVENPGWWGPDHFIPIILRNAFLENVPYNKFVVVGFYILLFGGMIYRWIKCKRSFAPEFSDYCLAAAASYPLTTYILPHFTRHSLSVGFLLVLGIAYQLFKMNRTLLNNCIPIAMSIIFVFASQNFAKYYLTEKFHALEDENYADLTPIPYNRNWEFVKSGKIKAIDFRGGSDVPSLVFESMFKNQFKMKLEKIADAPDSCLVGEVRAVPGARVFIELHDGSKGEFCY